MSFVEYKAQHRPKNSSVSFLLFLLASVLLHGTGVLVVAFWNQWASSTQQEKDYAAIEFVTVPPQASPDKPPPETQRRAAVDSAAQGSVQPEFPPATNEIPEEAPAAARDSQAAQPEAPPSKPIAKAPEVPPFLSQEPEPSVKPEPSRLVPPEKIVEPPQLVPLPPPIPNQTSLLTRSESFPAQSPDNTASEDKTPIPDIPRLDLPREATRLSPSPKPVPPVSQPSEPRPTTSKPPIQQNIPTQPSAQKPLSPSGPASLLAGTQSRSIQEPSDSSFFNPQASASREAPDPSGLDARQDVDFGPYFAELKRRVRQNWNPAAPSSDRHTLVAFSIHRDGRMTGLRVLQTSGSKLIDEQTIEAIQKSAPFAALPENYPHDRLNIQFGFNIYVGQGTFRPDIKPSWQGF